MLGAWNLFDIWCLKIGIFPRSGIMVFFGALLTIIGIFLLLRNLGIISGQLWDVLWPSFLILIGIKLLLQPRKWHKFWDQFGSGGKKIEIE